MGRRLTSEEIEAMPPTLTFGQTAQILGWSKNVVAAEVRAERFPVKGIHKGARIVLPKQAVLDMLAGRLGDESAA